MIAGGSIAVRPVSTRAELRQFITLPFRLYRDDPNWVPPLLLDRLAFFNRKKNPYYRAAEVELFLAWRDGHPEGRIAACVDSDYNAFHETQVGSFGFFESVRDAAVARSLFEAAADWVRARGARSLLGPLNFSTNHEAGFLAEGFDAPPVVMMPYNPPYYLELAEAWGLVKAKDLLAFRIDREHPPPDRVRRIAARVRDRNRVSIRNLDLGDFDAEIERVREIYNMAWSRNWGFVPLREAEFRHIAKDMKLILQPNLAFIALIDGRPAGFCLSLPNVYEAQIRLRNGRLLPTGLFKLLWHLKVRKSVHSMRIITMGVVPEYQKRGIETIFYVETFDRATAAGYVWGEISWVLEDNDLMIRAAETLGSARYKTYRVYETTL